MKTYDSTKRITHPKASNNNCFFKCIQPFIPSIRERITKSECNRVRKEFNLEADSLIDVKTAVDIFQKYSDDRKYGLEVWSNDVLVAELLSLEDDHYSMIEIKKYQQCTECGRKYISKHTCNTNMKVFKMITEGKNRYVIDPFKRDKFNFDVPNDKIVIVHYDIEMHTRRTVDGLKIHTPYVLR